MPVDFVAGLAALWRLLGFGLLIYFTVNIPDANTRMAMVVLLGLLASSHR